MYTLFIRIRLRAFPLCHLVCRFFLCAFLNIFLLRILSFEGAAWKVINKTHLGPSGSSNQSLSSSGAVSNLQHLKKKKNCIIFCLRLYKAVRPSRPDNNFYTTLNWCSDHTTYFLSTPSAYHFLQRQLYWLVVLGECCAAEN